MKLYVGSHDYRPEGFLTVDIDPIHHPDIVADITDMRAVAAATVDVLNAGHVLEHLEWPNGFKALSEFARVLRPGGRIEIAVPDVGALVRMLLGSQHSQFHAMGLLFGVGGRSNPFEAHRYGYTVSMLIEMLEVLGFKDFDWWNSDLEDASNGWVHGAHSHSAMSLNVAGTKGGPPHVDTAALYQELIRNNLDDFTTVAAKLIGENPQTNVTTEATAVYQSIGFKLIDARARIRHLEAELARARNRSQ